MANLYKFQGSFIGLAIGDGRGMATESKTKEEIKQEFGWVNTYLPGYLEKGHYTDDTQQAIILAESLLHYKALNKSAYGKSICERTSIERGIGPSLMAFIKSQPLEDQQQAPCYPSNGLPMKIAAAAMFLSNNLKNPLELTELVIDIASLTHKHPASVAGGIAIAHAVQYGLTHSSEFDRTDFIETVVKEVKPYDQEIADILVSGNQKFDNSCSVYTTVPNAILTFADNPHQFETGINLLVNSGGDTDTKAAMFGAISGAYNGIDKIPVPMIIGLENEVEGRDHILALAQALSLL